MKNKAKNANRRVVRAAIAALAVAAVVAVMVTMALLGVFRLEKRTLVICSVNASVTYTGENVVIDDGWSMSAGSLAAGDVLTVTMDADAVNAGSYDNTFSVTVTNKRGRDVTDSYDVQATFGKLVVKPCPVTFTSGSAEKEYDGLPLTCDEVTLSDGTLCDGQTFRAVTDGSQTDAGTSDNTFTIVIKNETTGEDVTANYDITYDTGTLTVTPIILSFASGSAEKEYDGTPLTCDEVEMTGGRLHSGHTYSVTATGSQTEVGTSDNTFTVVVTDASTGADVTANYEINADMGQLTVTPVHLIIVSGSASKVYDGTPLTCHETELVSGCLMAGHSLDVEVTGSQTEVGESQNVFDVRVKDAAGHDVTDCYRITPVCGKLEVISSGSGGGTEGDSGYYHVLTDHSGTLYLREMNFGGTYNFYNFDDPETWYGETTSPMLYAGSAMAQDGAEEANCVVYMPKAKASVIYRIMPYYLTDGNEDETSDVLHMVSRDTSYTYTYVPYTYDGGTVSGTLTGTMAAEEKEYRDWVYANYLDVPESTAEVFRELAAANGLSADSPTIVEDVIDYISHAAKYNLNYTAEPKDVDRAVYFLTVSKEGICQHYAVAATLMFRILGIPARYVQGYMVTVEAYVKTKITSDMGHAWTEIYVDGIGWMQVDATAGSDDGEGSNPQSEPDADDPDAEEPEEQDHDGEDPGYKQDEAENMKNVLRGMAPLTIKTGDASKTYDGNPIDGLTCEWEGTLVAGDYVDGYVCDATYNVGVHPNQTKPLIRDANGRDVTIFYTNIIWDSGSLTILPASLTIKSGSASKAYDGQPLSCTDYTILSGKLMPGDEICIVRSTQRTAKGAENNVLTIEIYRNNIDVTTCYALQQQYGTLTVTQ